ncbi:hypothetical protein [Devosia chinhatensis]|uniref:Uncharacterized protein n=1 Tax=Devosia chinhatensis TaxID=429727 RepID=A0A0F5FPE8_9HYPH|nr:hypothetical protein [Devosia chinhatensis]KKB10042.1 hypothetical protein VE26_09650 [Devosia chinhatensis]
MFRFALVAALTFASLPALAQGIEGAGTQTQSLDLLGGAVSVELQSGGDVSLGRGDDGGSAGASVSVNGIGIGLGNSGGTSGSAQSVTSVQSREDRPAANETSRSGAVLSPDETGADGEACIAPSAWELGQALDYRLEVVVRASECQFEPAIIDELLSSQRILGEALSAANINSDAVQAITIGEKIVISLR